MRQDVRSASALVVGGAGFIGGNLVRRCLDDGWGHVTLVDNFLSAEPENVPDDDRVTLRVASVADDDVLAALEDEFDVVFHLATYHGNQSSIADPLADHENNLLTTLKLYERLKGFRRLVRVVYASTGCAVAAKGEGPSEPVVEDGPVPLDYDSPYQVSKIAGEMYSLYYWRAHGLPVVRARFQNVYGPGEVLGAGRWRGTEATVWRNVVPTFVYRALKGETLQLHGEGTATRDFIHVRDVVDGLLCCATVRDAAGDVFNLASGSETTIRQLAETILDLTGRVSSLEFLPARTWDRSLHRVGSTAKARADLDFEAQIGLRRGLEDTVAWTREHLVWIESCIAKHAHRLEGARP